MYSVQASSAENRTTTVWLELEEGPNLTFITHDPHTNTRVTMAPPISATPDEVVTTLELDRTTEQFRPDQVIFVRNVLCVYVHGHEAGLTVARGHVTSRGKGHGKGASRTEPY